MKALAAALSALLVTTVAHPVPQYRLTDLGEDSPRFFFEPRGINANGDIVGTEVQGLDVQRAGYVQHSTGAWVSLPPFLVSMDTNLAPRRQP